ncbi:MAG: FtsQ-type POTRA domain-containing protein [Anaerolineae bacterium]|nr:FtsQ-type POTRA domain-containing protein [Anaerolineae bacterium]
MRRQRESRKYAHTVGAHTTPRISARERRRLRREREKAREREMQKPAARPKPRLIDRLPRLRVGWRLVSFLLVVGLVSVLLMFIDGAMFYVNHIYVGGVRYLPPEEIYGLSGIANLHIFWVDPAAVARAVERDPAIADAQVEIGWPSRVDIRVVEREPSIIWEQADVRTWVDVQGYIMPMRADDTNLLRIVVEGVDTPISPYERIPKDIVDGALQLRALRPNIDVLFLHPVEGLGLLDGRGWRVYFGTGDDMAEKLLVYESLVEAVWQGGSGVWPELFDVGDLRAPYYRVGSSSG